MASLNEEKEAGKKCTRGIRAEMTLFQFWQSILRMKRIRRPALGPDSRKAPRAAWDMNGEVLDYHSSAG
jgi:hypothetical protein